MLTSVSVMRAQEKVKRELAEIKDAKTQLERELERKNRQLLSAESEPAAAPERLRWRPVRRRQPAGEPRVGAMDVGSA